MGEPMIVLLWEAMREYGLQEIPGPKHNQRIMQMLREVEFPFHDDETSWCGTFISAMAKRAGLTFPERGFSARAWLEWGESVPADEVMTGDVVVYWRSSKTSWKGHVGLFISRSPDGKGIYTLGGNQRNMVSIQLYKAERVLGFRRI